MPYSEFNLSNSGISTFSLWSLFWNLPHLLLTIGIHLVWLASTPTDTNVGCYTSKLSANARMCNPLSAIQCQDPEKSRRSHPPISVPNQHDTAYQKTKSKKYCTRNDDVNIPKWHIVLYGKTICIKILQLCKNDDDPLSCAPLRSCGIPAGG